MRLPEDYVMTKHFKIGMRKAIKTTTTPFKIVNDKQARGYAYMMYVLPFEERMSAWARIQKGDGAPNLFIVHPYIEQLMATTASGANIDGTFPHFLEMLKHPRPEPSEPEPHVSSLGDYISLAGGGGGPGPMSEKHQHMLEDPTTVVITYHMSKQDD